MNRLLEKFQDISKEERDKIALEAVHDNLFSDDDNVRRLAVLVAVLNRKVSYTEVLLKKFTSGLATIN